MTGKSGQSSNYPGGWPQGMTMRNMPVSSMLSPLAKEFWVDNGSGSDQNKGTFRRPFKTTNYAVTQCKDDNGDVINLATGSDETISADAGVAMNKKGVTIIGHGTGTLRPTFTVNTATAANMAISADNCAIFNVIFLGGVTGLVDCLELSGDGIEVGWCEFRESVAMKAAITIGLADGDSDYAWVHDCVIRMDEPGITNEGVAGIQIVKDSDNIVIERMHIVGDFDDAGIHVPAGGNACDFLVIRDSYVENTKSGAHAIEITTGGTMVGGLVENCRMVSPLAATLFEPHTLQCINNIGSTGVVETGDFPIPSGWGYGARGKRVVKAASTTFTAAAYESGQQVAVFTVTGEVFARAWGHVTTAIESDVGNDGALSVGTEDNLGVLIPVTVADQTNFGADDVWAGPTTTTKANFLLNDGAFAFISSGQNIELSMTVEDATAGVLDLWVEWYPVSKDGDIVPV